MNEIILIGTPRTATSDAADLLLDAIALALQDFDTDTLNAIADYREGIYAECWMPKLIRSYIEVWR